MDFIHKALQAKSSLYNRWHKQKYHSNIHDAAIVIVFIFASFNIINSFGADFGTIPLSKSSLTQSSSKKTLNGHNTALLQMTTQYNAATGSQKQAKLSELSVTAINRKTAMLDAAQNNPKAFLL